MRAAIVRTAEGTFRQTVTIGPHTLTADEPIDKEGSDQGPEPHEFLLAGLGACTSMTLKLYADRKGWPLERCEVEVSLTQEGGVSRFERKITLHGALDEDQRKRLLDIANKCPVHKTLTGKIEIASSVV
jgi:putative redox protein